MSPIHFQFIQEAFNSSVIFKEYLSVNMEAVEVGLKYVNNDACYPSLMVVGQLMDSALKSGKYDIQKYLCYNYPDWWGLSCYQLY